MSDATIIYTHTDEAPALATYSLLPIIRAYAAKAGVTIETRDISLAGRILAAFPESLTPEQRVDDALSELGAMVKEPEANIIKLPNVSASIPQLKAAIAELQAQGAAIPNYPDDASSPEELEVLARFKKILGSAVNPVLREGNSDRRAPASVKNYAKTHPHRMGAWEPTSKTNVAHMSADDFASTEQSVIIDGAGSVSIDLVDSSGNTTPLRAPVPVLDKEIIDAAVMRADALDAFLAAQIATAKAEGVLFSIHLKATMMKISDPIIFGHVVRAFFPVTFATYGDVLAAAGLSPNNGLGSILDGLSGLAEGAAGQGRAEPSQAGGVQGARQQWRERRASPDRGAQQFQGFSGLRAGLHRGHGTAGGVAGGGIVATSASWAPQ